MPEWQAGQNDYRLETLQQKHSLADEEGRMAFLREAVRDGGGAPEPHRAGDLRQQGRCRRGHFGRGLCPGGGAVPQEPGMAGPQEAGPPGADAGGPAPAPGAGACSMRTSARPGRRRGW
ncbi:MAG: hypothetical protein ACLRWQ_18970 [Flavonifractor plautii]